MAYDQLTADVIAENANLAAENARLRQQLEAVTKERDNLGVALKSMMGGYDKLIDERAAMRPVVEAAEAWRALQTLPEPFADDEVLIAAVDAWRAAQPDQKGPSDGLSASVGDERGGAEGAYPITIGGFYPDTGVTVPTGDIRIVDRSTGETLGTARIAPADPAGLDAAIGAAHRAFDDTIRLVVTGEEEYLATEAAVRAAAPHIRRAVLLETADACDVLDVPQIAKWCRERAERETTDG